MFPYNDSPPLSQISEAPSNLVVAMETATFIEQPWKGQEVPSNWPIVNYFPAKHLLYFSCPNHFSVLLLEQYLDRLQNRCHSSVGLQQAQK